MYKRQNQETWDFGFGKPYTEETEREILEALAPGYIAGLSLLGGEPFEPVNQEVLVGLLRKFKERFPKKTVWCYTCLLYTSGGPCRKCEKRNPESLFCRGRLDGYPGLFKRETGKRSGT